MSLVRCKNGHLFSARKYGSICPYCSMEAESSGNRDKILMDESDKVVSLLDSEEMIEPVTGWLVCIEGPRRGKDYKIRAGKNFIGRAHTMQIRIIGDNEISRVNHAVIIYDKKNRVTHLLPGDSMGLAYLNGDAVFTPAELTAFSVVEMGQSKFLFIPLCGEHFEWENKGV
jgi:hypothetical protein